MQQQAFILLGYHISKISFERNGNEDIDEFRIKIINSKYNNEEKVYSLKLRVEVDFEQSKKNFVDVLGGFRINDDNLLNDENFMKSLFSATLFPFIRSIIYNVTSDDREAVKLPSVDLRNVYMNDPIIIKKEKNKSNL